MEQPFSTSKVTVEYFDPHQVYKLLAPGLIPRLPLRDLNWQSHAGPLRSIHTLHVDLVVSGSDVPAKDADLAPSIRAPTPQTPDKASALAGASRDDGLQTSSMGGRTAAAATEARPGPGLGTAGQTKANVRRHQIPGLRRTPYLKVLLVRCDDNETYKSTRRSEIRDWIKAHTPPAQRKSMSTADNHDAFEWLILHVVIPNTVAATQPRDSRSDSGTDVSRSTSASRWRGGSSTLLEKLRSDFNASGKGPDRVAQIRIGINDVPYDILPRVVPAVPTGYLETEQDAERAWAFLMARLKELILSSFDQRVGQYEDEIKERDAQRSLPGWNFCTFFMLKEGLARGFESVGLVEDALVGYDELSVGLETVLTEQAKAGAAEAHGGALLRYTEELKEAAEKATRLVARGKQWDDDKAVEGESGHVRAKSCGDNIPISATKKPYRELILENKVSAFDFRCYIFARQISLLLRLGNAWSTREELLAKLREQQESVLLGVAPRALPPKPSDEGENLARLAEICRRAVELVPSLMAMMRKDVEEAMTSSSSTELAPVPAEVVDNMVASFGFSTVQQMLAQTSTKAWPIPPFALATADGPGQERPAVAEHETATHPARSSSLLASARPATRPPPSPGVFPGPGRTGGMFEATSAPSPLLKDGLKELAAGRGDLYALCRRILEDASSKRAWGNGWASAPMVGDVDVAEMQEIGLDDEAGPAMEAEASGRATAPLATTTIGVGNELLRAALEARDGFYRLYESLTDKALRHYAVASHSHNVQAQLADLAVLKYHLHDYSGAAACFYRATPFFGETGWSLLELSMLVMYCTCLKQLRRQDEYVRVLIKLLCKAAAAEKDRGGSGKQLEARRRPAPRHSSVSGFLAELLDVSKTMEGEVKVQMAHFFSDVELDGPPVYDEAQDGFGLTVKLRSLLADKLEVQRAGLRIAGGEAGGRKEIWLQSSGPLRIRPGQNRMQLRSHVFMAGQYEADQVFLSSANLSLHLDAQTSPVRLRRPHVTLFQRTSALDVRLAPAKHVQMDRTSGLELQLLTGWNAVTSCEVRLKAATGGLRLLLAEADVLGAYRPTRAHEAGVFAFGAMAAHTAVTIRIPYTLELDVAGVAVRADVNYATSHGSFVFCKIASAQVALALGVNVQDFFKHTALFCRFAVSTASASPLFLFGSELRGSDAFEAHATSSPRNPVTVFPQQPASLLYKITRKAGAVMGSQTSKTLYLQLRYGLLLDEIEALLDESLAQHWTATSLAEYGRLVVSNVLSIARRALAAPELEWCALVGELCTSFLAGVAWEQRFAFLGCETATRLALAMRDWQAKNAKMVVRPPASASSTTHHRSILIPVDIPPITVVHTADIRLRDAPLPIPFADPESGAPAVRINQLLPATLHLKWTRIWDTAEPLSSASPGVGPAGRLLPALHQDLEFSYEITAAADTWLLAGRRKGHFVIPSAASPGACDLSCDGMSSTPETEADIPLVLVPLREGWLPYPMVDVQEVKAGPFVGGTRHERQQGYAFDAHGDAGPMQRGHYEMDYRNLGETVHVVADRRSVTLSLDASGPGGGPLVLESERSAMHGRVVA